eukprot:12147684-Karenia_brevis.AAC.1
MQKWTAAIWYAHIWTRGSHIQKYCAHHENPSLGSPLWAHIYMIDSYHHSHHHYDDGDEA